MPTRDQLLEIIRNGENSGVEFKRDGIANHDLAKELVAFANLDGGMVLLGVEDDGRVSGIARDRLEEWVMTACRDKIRPGIVPFFEVVRDVEEGRHVACVRVLRGAETQCLWHNNRRTYYGRVGSQSRELSSEELARLFEQRGALSVEPRPLSGAGFECLDVRRLRDYFGRVRQQEVPESDDGSAWKDLLELTEVTAGGAATVAGMLLFGQDPNRFLPQAGIDALALPGIEKDYAAVERAGLRGPMAPLLTRAGKLAEPGLVEEAVSFVRRNTRVTARLEDGARRVERRTYPDEVVREAVVNALIHRDYLLSGADIELVVYSDRLEVVSPGRLANGVTPEAMRVGVRTARNPMLKDVMRDYGYVEHMGLGVPRKIVRGMREHNGTDPELVEAHERFTVRLFDSDPDPPDGQ